MHLVTWMIQLLWFLPNVQGRGGIVKCPGNCESDPCGCSESNIINSCQICNEPSGCAQCLSNKFKGDYHLFCEDCVDIFGDACTYCQDFNGCGLCDVDNGFSRSPITYTYMHYCTSEQDFEDVSDNGQEYLLEL